MITLQIGTSERRDGEIEKRWIQDQVNSRKKNGESVCVRIHIQCGDVNLRLKSRDCSKSTGGSRPLNNKEQHIVDEWTQKGFPNKDINPGMVVSFWEFLKRTCE